MLKESVEEEWEGKSHLPKKELIQTTGSMEDDSVADDKRVGRQVKAGVKSGWEEREELYFLKLVTRKYLYVRSQKEKQHLDRARTYLSENKETVN